MLKTRTNSTQKIKQSQQLKIVAKSFEHWRKTKKKRDRIPDHLWEAAVSLSKEHSINKIASYLGLDYNCLKQRIIDSKHRKASASITGQSKSKKKDTITFVDIPFVPNESNKFASVSNSFCIEIRRTDGSIMRLSFPDRFENQIFDIIKLFISLSTQ